LGEEDNPDNEEAEGDLTGDGGGKAREGSRAIGRNFLGVEDPLSVFL